jgi:hypothetical protein
LTKVRVRASAYTSGRAGIFINTGSGAYQVSIAAIKAYIETDPCAYIESTAYAIDLTADTKIATGVAGQKFYICSLAFNTATAQNIAFIEGTGALCGTGTVGVIGGNAAAKGFNFADNQGISWGSGKGTVAKTSNTGYNLCIDISGTAQVSGAMTYVLK